MVEGKRVAVVVPAYEEEHLVGDDARAGSPTFVDRIFVVDDASPAMRPPSAHAAAGDPRVEVIVARARTAASAPRSSPATSGRSSEEIDVVCVMAADNQMDPAELASLVEPVARGEVDYAKANRLFTGEAWKLIPRTRYLGNAVLSLLTKIASGYWHVADSQAGYTASRLDALRRLDLDRIYRRYGFPNDMLVHLNVHQRTRARHPLTADLRRRRAVGDPSAQGRAADLVAAREGLLLADAGEVRDPRLPPARLLLRARLRHDRRRLPARHRSSRSCGSLGNEITTATIVLVALLLVSGTQFTLFAMWFDMEANKDLR